MTRTTDNPLQLQPIDDAVLLRVAFDVARRSPAEPEGLDCDDVRSLGQYMERLFVAAEENWPIVYLRLVKHMSWMEIGKAVHGHPLAIRMWFQGFRPTMIVEGFIPVRPLLLPFEWRVLKQSIDPSFRLPAFAKVHDRTLSQIHACGAKLLDHRLLPALEHTGEWYILRPLLEEGVGLLRELVLSCEGEVIQASSPIRLEPRPARLQEDLRKTSKGDLGLARWCVHTPMQQDLRSRLSDLNRRLGFHLNSSGRDSRFAWAG
jgi:hypothetical protein